MVHILFLWYDSLQIYVFLLDFKYLYRFFGVFNSNKKCILCQVCHVSKILCISKSPRYFCGFFSVHSYSRNLTSHNLGESRASFTFLTPVCNQLLWPARPIITVTIRSGLEAFTPTNPLLTQRIITSCDNFTTTPDPLTRSTPRTYSLRYWPKI